MWRRESGWWGAVQEKKREHRAKYPGKTHLTQIKLNWNDRTTTLVSQSLIHDYLQALFCTVTGCSLVRKKIPAWKFLHETVWIFMISGKRYCCWVLQMFFFFCLFWHFEDHKPWFHLVSFYSREGRRPCSQYLQITANPPKNSLDGWITHVVRRKICILCVFFSQKDAKLSYEKKLSGFRAEIHIFGQFMRGKQRLQRSSSTVQLAGCWLG